MDKPRSRATSLRTATRRTQVPPGGDVLGDDESGGTPVTPGDTSRYNCPAGTVLGANGTSCVEPRDPGTGREAGGQPSAGSTLPFTGVDLAAIAGVGLLLAGLGVGLRRLTNVHGS